MKGYLNSRQTNKCMYILKKNMKRLKNKQESTDAIDDNLNK